MYVSFISNKLYMYIVNIYILDIFQKTRGLNSNMRLRKKIFWKHVFSYFSFLFHILAIWLKADRYKATKKRR